MDSFTLNKIAGAVLGTCLFGMGLGLVGQAIYYPSAPTKPGYALPEPKPEEAAGGKKPAETPLPVLLAKADSKKGEQAAKVCGACHNFAEGAGNKVGPDLYDVVERPKGSVSGFDYSSGLKGKGGKWTFADLNTWLTNPAAFVSGTKMGYPGEEDPQKRADIIDYLDTLSKKPVPLPKPSAAEEQAGNSGGATKTAEGGTGGGSDDLIKMIAASDPKKGEQDAKVCGACHNFKEGGGTLVGPDLYGVVDRPKGSVAGFDYSSGLKAKGGKWTYADLNTWLTNPSAYVAGTKMGYAGEENQKKRAEIIAYLRSLAKTPAPLPAEGEKKADAGAAAKPAEAGAPATAGGGSFAKLVAAADPAKGKGLVQICMACHNFKEGGGTIVGPDLYGVVDRPKGSVAGFDYSSGLKAKGGNWTYDDLNTWLTNPSAFVPGTKMGYAGEDNEKKRAEIVAFLRSNAKTPAPLPGADAPKPEPASTKPSAPAPVAPPPSAQKTEGAPHAGGESPEPPSAPAPGDAPK